MRAVEQLGRHRAEGEVQTKAAHVKFRPRHCGGETCVHDHAGDHRPSLGVFRSLLERARGAA